ncbi:hypothetical protein FSP39_010484 [Pinctada imbricata]|uniref:Methyltransferase domain-containing protein n=1 Tax=Pinctada imbricata TaxID=66713 RepID=A0AA88XDL1_PINIB|nr:hypothetical protein FSP39_010484 [Pinctada imbricata]
MLILPVKSTDEGLIKQMMSYKMFSGVAQLTLNFYLNSHVASSSDYKRMLVILRLFYDAGFRIFWFDRPWECAPVFGKLNHCYNVYLKRLSTISVNFVEKVPSQPMPTPKSPKNYITLQHLEIYYRYITVHQYLCKQIVRFGNIKDGGWEVCHDFNFRPAHRKCLVYSFGINNDWSFDDDVTQTYECELHAFDPSMRIPSHMRSKFIHFHNLGLSNTKEIKTMFGSDWHLSDLKSIISDFGHVNRTIDILKLDIESFEKKALPQMLESGVLNNVVQLSIEFHNFRNLTALQLLYNAGFRMYWSHQNHYSKSSFNNDSVAKAMEVYYVNINKIKRFIDE